MTDAGKAHHITNSTKAGIRTARFMAQTYLEYDPLIESCRWVAESFASSLPVVVGRTHQERTRGNQHELHADRVLRCRSAAWPVDACRKARPMIARRRRCPPPSHCRQPIARSRGAQHELRYLRRSSQADRKAIPQPGAIADVKLHVADPAPGRKPARR